MRNHSFLALVLLLVVGVFGVTDGVKSVSVMEGDSVTLLTNLTEIQTGEDLKWKFPDDTTIIAEIDRGDKDPSVPGNDESFKGRLKLDAKTGSLTITNIKTTDSGVYKLQISKQSWSGNKEVFSVSVRGVFSDDGVKKMSAKEGESVILHTRIISIPEDDEIEWTFGPQDTALVKTDRQNNIYIYNEDVTFKDRLQLNTKSGDLTVKNINTEDSGLYKVKIIKRTHTLQKIFSVTVDDSQERSGSTIAVSVICGAGVVLLAVGLTVCWKKRKQSRPRYPDDVQSTEIILN